MLKRFVLLGLLLTTLTRLWSQSQPEPLPEVHFFPIGGFYQESVEVKLDAAGATIYYTTDGTRPSRRSPVYTKPLQLRTSTVVRAVVYKNGKPGRYCASTYFVNEPATNFPVVSIGITPKLLFDPEKGLFMQGSKAVDTTWQKFGANFWSYKEVTAHIEIFESDGKSVHNSLSGFRLFGGMSRLFPQKSLTLVAREKYGARRFDYPIFGKDAPKDFKFLVLRNSGSDWGKSHMRDALMIGLLDEWDIDKQAYRPCHVYINGMYWGIYDIREKINRYFIEAHNKEVDKDSIDFLEHNVIKRRGSTRHYRRMLAFLEKNSLRDPQNYAQLQQWMDIENFMQHQIAQIYFDNQDAGGNIKYWRPRTPDGRWRWIIYDTDWGFGLHDEYAYLNNSLAFHTEPNGPAWPNPAWSTFLLRKLLENPDFSEQFVNRFADHLNTTFHPKRVEGRINAMYENLKPEMPRQIKRWRLDPQKWEQEVSVLRTFARERPLYARLHLMDRFNTGAMRTLRVQAEGGGMVLINSNVKVRTESFEGVYFANIPITLKVIPQNGYRFVRWEGIDAPSETRELTLKLQQDTTTIRAIFEKFEHPLAGKVIINEISANNRQSSDWVEIFNNSEEEVNLRDWVLSDLKNEFLFPYVTIAPNDYLVVCEDTKKFFTQFPNAYNVIGGLNFGLNKRAEQLQLFASYGAVVDSVYYELPPTDSTFTLNLLLPNLDNSDVENWETRPGVGSPNAPNPYFLESRIHGKQKQWMEIGFAAGVVVLCVVLLVLRQKRIL
ncbi:MAG: CotH kinase family protein [Saprospiraceae bacterium]